MTSLQNRGLVNSLMASPFILNAFVAGYITDGISAFSADNWYVAKEPSLSQPEVEEIAKRAEYQALGIWDVCNPRTCLYRPRPCRPLLGRPQGPPHGCPVAGVQFVRPEAGSEEGGRAAEDCLGAGGVLLAPRGCHWFGATWVFFRVDLGAGHAVC